MDVPRKRIKKNLPAKCWEVVAPVLVAVPFIAMAGLFLSALRSQLGDEFPGLGWWTRIALLFAFFLWGAFTVTGNLDAR